MIKTDSETILEYLNELTGRKYRPIKTNTSKIEALFKDGYSIEEIKEVIQIKTLDWKNSPKMSKYLRPSTLFKSTNFENYINEVIDVKNNPKMYKKHYEQLNKKPDSNIQSSFDDIDQMYS